MSIIEFCDRHNACKDGRAWAVANCRDMDHAWETLKTEWLIWVATRKGVLDDRTLRLFAVWCCREVSYLLKDERSIAALDVAERYANGQATCEELAVAWDGASDAALAIASATRGAASWSAAKAASNASNASKASEASDAASAIALPIAREASWAASWSAARAASWAGASAATRAAALDAARNRQVEWLRANAKPSWEAK